MVTICRNSPNFAQTSTHQSITLPTHPMHLGMHLKVSCTHFSVRQVPFLAYLEHENDSSAEGERALYSVDGQEGRCAARVLGLEGLQSQKRPPKHHYLCHLQQRRPPGLLPRTTRIQLIGFPTHELAQLAWQLAHCDKRERPRERA